MVDFIMESFDKILGNALSKIQPIKETKKHTKVKIKDELVIQHNHLIEARYRLSLQEKRVVLWLLTQIKPDDEDFKLHKLEIIEFSKMVGLKSTGQYTELQNVTGNLIKRVFKIHESRKQEIIQISWLSAAKYQIGKGHVLLEFSPQLKPYLLQLKSHFTKLSIVDIMQLNSIYSMRFYELLKQYESIKKRTVNIKDLREYCGIAETEYIKYNNFKRNVLERAKKEINEKTDIVIDYREIKESRKITTIEWTIRKKNIEKEKQLKKLAAIQKEFRSEAVLINALMEYDFSKLIAKRFIKDHGEDIVRNAVRAVDLQVKRGKAKNAKAMLQTAIKEKWDPKVYRPKKTSK